VGRFLKGDGDLAVLKEGRGGQGAQEGGDHNQPNFIKLSGNRT